ncbi:VOC family protein [Kiloniella laminariae]|uniref:VOC family protein n=1 Tax=Kiloniella laminariae TaxID=454162 RepID=UPI0003A5A77A|nr:glyoxalase/bleomycin resistance/dioxygenase family protein [Kiloniella laminariae]
MTAKFSGGKNIAMKVPPHQYDATVKFYRDLLGLEQIGGPAGDAVGFKFGSNNLWIDKVPAMSQAELWLEIVTDDTTAAAKVLSESGIVRCDEIEDLGKSFDGYWVSSPASIIHLVNAQDGSWD